MPCDVEHTMVKSKDLSISPECRYKYLGVAQALKTNLALKHTHTRNILVTVAKRDLKRLKHAPGSGVGLSVFICTPNYEPQAAQITKSLFS